MLCRKVSTVNTNMKQWRTIGASVLLAASLVQVPAAFAVTRSPQRAETAAADQTFLAARDAFASGQRDRLAALAPRLASHPLAIWVEYWQLNLRLRNDDPARVDAAVAEFFARHADTYLADRLRMDWLLALGARRDFERFAAEHPALVWRHDDHQVRCYAALVRYQHETQGDADQRVREARRVLASSREPGGEGCTALGEALQADGHVSRWERLRATVELNQPAATRRLAAELAPAEAAQLAQALDRPAAFLSVRERRMTQTQRELALIALARLARENPEQAARHAAALNLHLSPAQRGLVWGRIGHMGALRLLPEALDWYRHGGEHVGNALEAARADEVLEWQMRAALRGTARGPDWAMVRATYERMGAELQRAPAWIYWNARALAAAGDEAQAHSALRSIAGRFNFYGKLAAETLGEPIALPPAAPAPTAEAVAVHAGNAGLARALRLIALDLRFEGNREWAWQLRQRSDPELLAIAEFARQRGAIDRMIATSERTRDLFDFEQRFPAPHRTELARHARAVGLDEAWVYGLIRQESRFIADARSSAGAQGLMQLMPATARYVARRVGMNDFASSRVNELDVNLRLGTSYLQMVLDDLDRQPLLASAAYNAGPARARAWRAALARPVEGAIFAETIPFNETRDYVQKVMSNAVVYAALFEGRAQSLKARLGTVVPRPAGTTELP